MWPDLFGPGWYWGVLIAFSLLGIFVALIWLCGDFRMPHETVDWVQTIRRRYEQRDLTRQEFERLKRAGFWRRMIG